MLRQTEIIAKKVLFGNNFGLSQHIANFLNYLKVLFNCCFLAIYSETQQVTCSAMFNEYA